jgi:hypothetical protein
MVEQIALRAYDKWQTRCGTQDRQVQDWLEAEAELGALADLTRRLAEGQGQLACLLDEGRLAERRLVAEHAIGNILAVSETLVGAAPQLVQALCESLGWDAGAVWVVDPTADLLRCVAVWFSPGIGLHAFARESLRTTFAAGAGLRYRTDFLATCSRPGPASARSA